MTSRVLFAGLLTLAAAIVHADEYQAQVSTIVRLYDVLGKPTPTMADFIATFGEDNEAEIALVLKSRFQGDPNGPKAVEYIKKIYAEPDKHESAFLVCLKSLAPWIRPEAKRTLALPPERETSFRRYVMTDEKGGKTTFIFSLDERTLEDIELPDRSSIYGKHGCVGRDAPSR